MCVTDIVNECKISHKWLQRPHKYATSRVEATALKMEYNTCKQIRRVCGGCEVDENEIALRKHSAGLYTSYLDGTERSQTANFDGNRFVTKNLLLS